MKSSPSDRQRAAVLLRDMLNSATLITEFLNGATIGELIENREKCSAVLWELMIIGEAAKKISPEIENEIPGIPFHLIRGTRNRIVHGYDDINLDTVWEIARTHIPALIAELENYFVKNVD